MATREGRTSHHPSDLFDASQYGFSQAVSVDAGRLIFVSGQVAWDANEGLVATDLSGQATAAMANLQRALAAAGAGLVHVSALRIYIVGDPPDTSGVSDALRAAFPMREGPRRLGFESVVWREKDSSLRSKRRRSSLSAQRRTSDRRRHGSRLD